MQFNEYLKSCRVNNDLTQEQLTHDLYTHDIDSFEGLETTTVSKWERGVTKPTITRQISILKYFQERTGTALPCWDDYTVDEAENLICKAGMRNIIGENKQIVCNYPSEMMSIDDMNVYPLRTFERIDALIENSIQLQQSFHHKSTHLSREQIKEWALHPDNLFLACEHKDSFLGYFFTLRVKPEIFNKIVNFEMEKSEITEDDLASFNEMGSIILANFFAMNEKSATMLMIRYYAYLIANQKHIVEMGGVTINDEAKKIVANMNLHYHSSKVTDDNVKIKSYRQTLANVLASENAVKMLLYKQECPEE